jgi:hypothetical protein
MTRQPESARPRVAGGPGVIASLPDATANEVISAASAPPAATRHEPAQTTSPG